MNGRCRVGALLAIATICLAASACTPSDGDSRSPVTPADPPAESSSSPGLTSTTPTVVASPGSETDPTTETPTTETPATETPSTPAPTTTMPEANLDAVSVTLTEIGEYDEPIAFVARPEDDGTIFLGERGGTVRAISAEDDITVLDISDDTEGSGERGLLGLAVSADGQYLYVSSTRTDGTSAIDEYPFTGSTSIDVAARRVVIEIDQPYRNHNGGHLVVGPDGMLYVGMGDGGSADDPERRALEGNELLGKMLRIDPSIPAGDLGYSVPADNPFVDVEGYRPEIWSSGLRNPWRFSFDRLTGDLWIGDVGQNEWEEIDFAPAADGHGRGVSFGWSAFEGTHRFNDDQPDAGHQLPIHEYSHESGDGNSVTGGFVYRGSAIPDLFGAYVFGDYETGNIWAITANADGSLGQGPVKIAEVKALSSFGEDRDGELYALSLNGSVSRFDPGAG